MEEREIYLLITRYLQQTTSTEENEILADWITSAPEHEQTFEEIKSVWQRVKQPKATSSLDALSQLKRKVNEEVQQQAKTKKLVPLKLLFIAASLLILCTASVIVFHLDRLFFDGAPEMQTLTTKAGEIKRITLSDGTMVCLGPKSKISYPDQFDPGQRSILLDGEGYFEVSKNPHKPFLVNTDNLSVKVLGTHFNVKASKNLAFTTVSLFEGKVEVNLNGDQEDAYQLKPGQELSVNRSNLQVFQKNLDSVSVLGWMTKTLIFSNDKLSDAASKIENMYGVKLIFADQATADTRLYAQFRDDKLEDVLEIICSTGNLNYKQNGNKIYLSTR